MQTTLNTTYMSKKGIKELKKAIKHLEADRHHMILELHDQDKTTDHDARLERVERLSQLDGIEQELLDKKFLLSNAKPFPRGTSQIVNLGSTVELASDDGQRLTYMLVDTSEANPMDGRISIKSPLGQSLLGKTYSDIINWRKGSLVRKFKLVRIS